MRRDGERGGALMEMVGGLGLLDRLEHLAPTGPGPDRRWLAERALPADLAAAVRDLFGGVVHTVTTAVCAVDRLRFDDPALLDWLATSAGVDHDRWPSTVRARWIDTIEAMYEEQGDRDPGRIEPQERVGKRVLHRRFVDLELLVMAVEQDANVQRAWASRPAAADALALVDWLAEVPCEVLDPPRSVLDLVDDVLQHNVAVGVHRTERARRTVQAPPTRVAEELTSIATDDPVADGPTGHDPEDVLRAFARMEPTRLRAGANHLLLDGHGSVPGEVKRPRIDARETPASVMLAVHAYAPAAMDDVRHVEERLRAEPQRNFLHLAVAAHTPGATANLGRTHVRRTLGHLRAVLARHDKGAD